MISIIVPVYNEEDTILHLLKKIHKEISNFNRKTEIIVVDDGSTDGTKKLLKENDNLYTQLIRKENAGKGSAVREGLQNCEGDIILIQDADLEYSPKDYPKLLGPILRDRSKAVYGSRFKNEDLLSEQRWGLPFHYLGNVFLSFVFSILYLHWIGDIETCYKCFTREVASELELNENDFTVEVEITSQIVKNGFELVEVPINYNPRSYSGGKKITLKDGLKALFYLIKSRLKEV